MKRQAPRQGPISERSCECVVNAWPKRCRQSRLCLSILDPFTGPLGDRSLLSANMFSYPYTKIEFIERELGVSRPTASKYLELLTAAGLVRKQKIGRTNYYINEPLYALLSEVTLDQS